MGIVLAVIFIMLLAGVFLALGQFYDYSLNYYMRGKAFAPDSVLSHKIKSFLLNSKIKFSNKRINPNLLTSNIQRAFYKVTGKEIDNEPEYCSLILAIMIQETGLRYYKRALPWLPIPERCFGAKTDGIMQAANVPNPNFYLNLVYNIQKLNKIVQMYASEGKIDDDNIKFIFADWCAGIYSCKIASLQLFLNRKFQLNPPLSPDGILGKETATALIMFKNYNSTDAHTIITDGINKSLSNDSLGIEKSRKRFIISNYYNELQQEYPELQTPVLSDTKVKNVTYKIRNKLSFSAGWQNSREYSEKAFVIYKKFFNKKVR